MSCSGRQARAATSRRSPSSMSATPSDLQLPLPSPGRLVGGGGSHCGRLPRGIPPADGRRRRGRQAPSLALRDRDERASQPSPSAVASPATSRPARGATSPRSRARRPRSRSGRRSDARSSRAPEQTSAPQRDVLALCVWSGLSYEEAALALAIPVGTVRSRLARARATSTEPQGPSRHKEVEMELKGIAER